MGEGLGGRHAAPEGGGGGLELVNPLMNLQDIGGVEEIFHGVTVPPRHAIGQRLEGFGAGLW